LIFGAEPSRQHFRESHLNGKSRCPDTFHMDTFHMKDAEPASPANLLQSSGTCLAAEQTQSMGSHQQTRGMHPRRMRIATSSLAFKARSV